MPVSARTWLPVTLAVLTVGCIVAFLFWQLEHTRALLTQALPLEDIIDASLTPLAPSSATAAKETDATLTHLRRGDVHALRGEWAEAQEEYQEAVDNGGGVPALRKLAQAQMQRRDNRGAMDTVDQLRRAGAQAEDVLLLESVIGMRSGEVERARQVLTAADDSPHKHYGLALLAVMVSDHDTAKTELNLVMAGWEPSLRASARLLLDAYDEYALFDGSPDIHLLTLLGRSLAQVQECELALPLLSQVTNAQDDYRDAWIVQGFCELSTERFTEARASLERAYQIDPEKPETQYFLARAYVSQNDHANALTYLQYALRNGFQPEAEVRRLIAREALQMNNAALALEQYESLASSPEADLQTFTDYVAAAIAAERFDEAFVKAQEAATKWPDDAKAYELLGQAAEESGRTDEARAALVKALELDPDLVTAKQRLESL